MTELDTFALLVDDRLRQWAEEVRGGCGSVHGYPTVNVLHPLAGVSTPRGPAISDETMLLEAILIEVEKEAPVQAKTVRAAYLCGSSAVERQRRAAQRAIGFRIGRRHFLTLLDDGLQRVREFMEFEARTSDAWTGWLNRVRQVLGAASCGR